MSDQFYRAFEERYYAPRSVIKQLRRQYEPFVMPVAAMYPGAPTFDIGCGRGEWLELMLEAGLSPLGVDLDAGMLQACVELKLPALQGDAVQYLSRLADNSQGAVTAFHVVEHISFDQLRTLVIEALRVLKPGGLLIMETPNPENILVATCNFYLDPTHQRPIPSQSLSFLTEFHGFCRSKVLRLQESPSVAQNSTPSLSEVLTGVSPDYAVVAQKAAPAPVLAHFDRAFAREYGLSQEKISARFDESIYQQRKQQQTTEVQIQLLHELVAQAQATAVHAIDRVQHAETGLHAIYSSRSWRITAPLRWVALQAQLLRSLGFKQRSQSLLMKVRGKSVSAPAVAPPVEVPQAQATELSPQAQRVYDELRAAVDAHTGPH